MAMRDDGEPIGRGQLDRRAADARALRDSLFAAAFFGGVVLIDGILAILLIEFFHSIGWWEIQPTGGAEGAAALSGRLGRGVAISSEPTFHGTTLHHPEHVNRRAPPPRRCGRLRAARSQP